MTKLELVHVLKESEREQVVLKVKVRKEENPLVVVVDKISDGEIFFKPYTIYGKRLKNTRYSFRDILKVMKLHLPYNEGIFPLTSIVKPYSAFE